MKYFTAHLGKEPSHLQLCGTHQHRKNSIGKRKLEKEGGETLIIAACRIGNLAIVKFLMSLGAQVTHEIEVITEEAGQ